MELDRKLNLIVPIERDGAPVAQVVAAPIGLATFRTYHQVIAKTFTRMYRGGLEMVGGPKVAALLLEDAARETPRGEGSWWEGVDGVENGLLNEIRRLANVLAPGDTGWQQIPYADALKRGIFSEDEALEVEGAIVFFTCNWCMHSTRQREAIIRAAGQLWGWDLSSQPLTELLASLRTSTQDEPTGVKVTA